MDATRERSPRVDSADPSLDTQAAPAVEQARPGILVFTTVFPNAAQPGLGPFVRERMFRIASHLPLVVVAPVPWFPFQGLFRRWRPGFRPMPPRQEEQQGILVLHPRFFCVPALLKGLDGLFLAVSCAPLLHRLRRQVGFQVIDSHFAYPDGWAAVRLGRWLKCPVSITLRGTEVSLTRFRARRNRILWAVGRADRVFTVADSIAEHLRRLGATRPIRRIGNGVDLDRFYQESRPEARRRLALDETANVLITVGGLCERKGFHRVIEILPRLQAEFGDVHYLVAGGPSPEGDWSDRLQAQARAAGVSDRVHFLGPLAPEALRWVLSAADLFVLATRNEGWANVLLEAMACGLPVVATDVGGNAEVICNTSLGSLVPFGDVDALSDAIAGALRRDWDRASIRAYAAENDWQRQVDALIGEFRALSRCR